MSEREFWDIFGLFSPPSTPPRRYGHGGGGASGSFQTGEDWVDEKLRELINARNLFDVLRVARALLGEQSFEAGVILGLAVTLRRSVDSLVDLGRCFVLAAVYETIERPRGRPSDALGDTKHASRGASDVLRAVRFARFSPRAWEQAYQQREKAVVEIEYVIEHAESLLGGPDASGLREYWTRICELRDGWSADGKLNSGRVFGELLARMLEGLREVADREQVMKRVPQLLSWALRLERPGGASSSSSRSGSAVARSSQARRQTGSQRSAARNSQEPAEVPVVAKPALPKKYTSPSRPPDPTAKPRGRRTKPHRNEKDPTVLRSLQRENDSAEILARNGYDVEQNPRQSGPRVPGRPNPDYKIEGETFDCYAPSANKSARGIGSEIDNKVNVKQQADRVVVNGQDWDGDAAALQRQLNDWPIQNLKEVIFIDKGGNVSHIFP